MMARLNLPSSSIPAEQLNEVSAKLPGQMYFNLLNELQRIQRDTILAVADCMNTGARQLALTKQVLTPEQLEAEAEKLRAIAEGIGK